MGRGDLIQCLACERELTDVVPVLIETKSWSTFAGVCEDEQRKWRDPTIDTHEALLII